MKISISPSPKNDTWPAGHVRPLTVFFVADEEVESRYVASDANWEAEVEGAKSLNGYQISTLAKHLDLTQSDIPQGAVVTKFVNIKNERGYGEDLYFTGGSVSHWPWIGGAVAVLTLALLLGADAPHGQ